MRSRPNTFSLDHARRALEGGFNWGSKGGLPGAFPWALSVQGYEFWQKQQIEKKLSEEGRGALQAWIEEAELEKDT